MRNLLFYTLSFCSEYKIIEMLDRIQDNNTFGTNSKLTNQTWPLFTLAFIRLFYVSIFERALANYLYFVVDISASALGFISAVGSLVYIIGPVFGQFITKRFLGIRNALILNCILTVGLTGAQIIYPELWFLIICRILLGLIMGLFWPNCTYLLSKWQKIDSKEKSKKNFALFNYSWNAGFIGGLVIGFIWAFTWNDYFAMITSWLISFLLIPVSFFLGKDTEIETSEKIVIYQSEDPLSHLDLKEDLTINSHTPMLIFPVLFSWISIVFLSISKTIFIFGYPVILKAFENPSYLTYLVQGGLQFFQLLGLTWINYMKPYTRKITTLLSVPLIVVVALTIILVDHLLFTSIVIIFVGLFLGLIHGCGMKIMLEYGTAENTSKYATINEILIGIGFGLTPIIAGYVVEVFLYGIFVFEVFFGLVVLLSLLFLSRNVKRRNPNNKE